MVLVFSRRLRWTAPRAYRWRPPPISRPAPISYVRFLYACHFSFPSVAILLSSLQLLMSHTHHTSTSSNFQLIFDNALEAYKKRTKKDLLTHSLAAQLQDCRSPSNILDVLQQQVQKLNQSRQRDERWTRWLDPTVKVLHAFSETLGHVTSVCLSS